MTAEKIHTCSYSCERPGCIRAQRDELAARLEALTSAPQPVSAGEEIMVSTPNGVFILTLQPSGLDGEAPRFVVHVPETKPAAVDDQDAQAAEIEALRAEVAAWRELSDHVRVGACAAIWPDRYTDARTRDVAAALKRAARMAEALEEIRSRSSMNLAMQPDPFELTARLGDIYQIADAALSNGGKA